MIQPPLFTRAEQTLLRSPKRLHFRGESQQEKEIAPLEEIKIDSNSSLEPPVNAESPINKQNTLNPSIQESTEDIFSKSLDTRSSSRQSLKLKHQLKRELSQPVRYVLRTDDTFWACSAITSAASPWVVANKAARVVFTLGLVGTLFRFISNYYQNRKNEMSRMLQQEQSQPGN